jgi:hypothetical protein
MSRKMKISVLIAGLVIVLLPVLYEVGMRQNYYSGLFLPVAVSLMILLNLGKITRGNGA